MRLRMVAGAGLLTGLLLTCGCASLARYDVNLKVDPDMRSANGRYPPVEVHLVVLDAVNSVDMAQRSITEYWKPGRRNDTYEAQKVPFFFGEEKPFEQTLSKQDSRWKVWTSIEDPKLWVIADLPGAFSEKSEPRRRCIPLERTRWRWLWSDRIDLLLSREKGICVRSPGQPAP